MSNRGHYETIEWTTETLALAQRETPSFIKGIVLGKQAVNNQMMIATGQFVNNLYDGTPERLLDDSMMTVFSWVTDVMREENIKSGAPSRAFMHGAIESVLNEFPKVEGVTA